MDLLLLISNILLWFCVFGLAAAYRGLSARASVTPPHATPSETIPSTPIGLAVDALPRSVASAVHGKVALILAMTADCEPCERLSKELDADPVGVVTIVVGDGAASSQWVTARVDQGATADRVLRALGIASTPYSIVIRDERVVGGGIVNTRAHVVGLLDATARAAP